MPEPTPNKGSYYSDQHRYLLLWAANHARRYLRQYNVDVEIEDLVNIGWLKCLRRFKADELSGKSYFLILTMIKYGGIQCKTTPIVEHEHVYDRLSDNYFSYVDAKDELINLCIRIPKLWLLVLKYRFFQCKTLKETGDLLGLSGERVRQIQRQFLAWARVHDTKIKRLEQRCHHGKTGPNRSDQDDLDSSSIHG